MVTSFKDICLIAPHLNMSRSVSSSGSTSRCIDMRRRNSLNDTEWFVRSTETVSASERACSSGDL